MKCAIINGKCPERGMSEKKKGCPAWGVWPEVNEKGMTCAVEGCYLMHGPRLHRVSMHRQDQLIGKLQQYQHALDANLARPMLGRQDIPTLEVIEGGD